jgi:hypothetical protein
LLESRLSKLSELLHEKVTDLFARWVVALLLTRPDKSKSEEYKKLVFFHLNVIVECEVG